MKKTVILLTLALFLVGTGLAAGENLAPETATQVSDTDKISFTDYRNVTIFDQLTSGLLSVTSTDSVYRPGETISFDVTAEFITEESGSFDKVVGIYKCYDSGCDDPNLDTRVDVFSESEFFYAQVGDKVSWGVDWQAPSEEGYYAATGYVNDPGNMVLTETPNRKIFEVREETQTEPQPEPEPDVVSEGEIKVYRANNLLTAEVPIKNVGDADMPDKDLLEMQVRPQGSGVLSVLNGQLSLVSGQDTCDSDYPENVHKKFILDAGDGGTISLSTNLDYLEDGQSYDVFLVSTEGCYPDNEPVPPFYDTGEKIGSFTVGGSDGVTDGGDDGVIGGGGDGDTGVSDRSLVEYVVFGIGLVLAVVVGVRQWLV